MFFSEGYELRKEEIAVLYKAMAENFCDDDLYRTIVPDAKKRKRMVTKYFKYYLQAIRAQSYFLADSQELHCVAVICDSSLESWRYPFALAALIIKMIPVMLSLCSWTSLIRMIKYHDMFTSNWIKQFIQTDYLHIDLLYTLKEMRHQGYAGKLLQVIINEADKQGKDITLETHHLQNLALYKAAGFAQMAVITHEDVDLKQYCLLKKK